MKCIPPAAMQSITTSPLFIAVNRPLAEYETDPVVAGRFGRAFRLDVCRDGTLTIRKHGQKAFNDRALPVYSVDTKQEALDLQVLLCFTVHNQHPDMRKGATWMKINDMKAIALAGQMPVLTLEQHTAFRKKITAIHACMMAHR